MFMALWPPRGSVQDQPYNNKTSYALIRIGCKGFLWNDFLPYAPTITNDNLDRNLLHNLVMKRHPKMSLLLNGYTDRLKLYLENEYEHGNEHPVVAWVGRTANEARKWLEENGSIAVSDSSSTAV
jgi:hypothetical protein